MQPWPQRPQRPLTPHDGANTPSRSGQVEKTLKFSLSFVLSHGTCMASVW